MGDTTASDVRDLGLPARSSYRIGPWLYGRVLGVVVVIAFGSLWSQVDGLMGEHGIAPAVELMERLAAAGRGFFDHPTLCWFVGADDGALHGLCAAGVFAGFLVVLGVFPRLSIVVAGAAYLSLVNVGYPFSAFQWDTLLIETCLCSVFVLRFGPWHRPSDRWEPTAIGRWVVYALLFRLMLRSGWVKLQSGDPVWADFSALSYHYETQPLPTIVGWFAHQLPDAFHVLCVLVMFTIELAVPLLVLVPHASARRVAAGAFGSLMLVIALTGNYGFFNLLAAALCLPLLDDDLLRRVMPCAVVRWFDRPGDEPVDDLPMRIMVYVAAGALLLLGTTRFVGGDDLLTSVDRFFVVNDYGLFAIMTTERPEIVVEGSMDGQEWHAYEFRYKPGDLEEPPRWNTPHQPRLDWQMWFAALGNYRQNAWLVRFEQKLLDAEPSVLELLAHDPFDGRRPRYVRAIVWDYRFTTPAERAETGAWWRRADPRPYTPVLSR